MELMRRECAVLVTLPRRFQSNKTRRCVNINYAPSLPAVIALSSDSYTRLSNLLAVPRNTLIATF